MKYSQHFKVAPCSKVKLKEIDPAFKDHHHENRKDAEEEIVREQERLRELQESLYADGRSSLFICLQGMDTAGKDGTINHIFAAMNPQGCRVAGFKQPSAEDLAHDFLWRIHQASPRRGEVTIFNRSHYEDVLVVHVHNLVPQAVWSQRYHRINEFEKGLVEQNTHIIKFFLHISKEEQLKRFKERLDDPTKQWKISEADYKERDCWDAHTTAYEDALSKCSTDDAPWYVIPADHKWFRNLAVGRIVVEHLEGLNLQRPESKVDLEHIRREYHAAKAV